MTKRLAETEMLSCSVSILGECAHGTASKVGSVLSEPLRKVRRTLVTRASSYQTAHCGDAVSGSGKGIVRTWRRVATTRTDVRRPPVLSSFTVCTYNMLSQSSLNNTMELYEKCEKTHLLWQHRSGLLLKELKALNADIFCLQEVDSDTYSTFDAFFNRRKYKGVYKKRTGDKNDGCAVFWKKHIFKLVEWVGIEYFIPNTHVDRDNVGQLVKLRLRRKNKSWFCRFQKKQDDYLIVANTHLLFNPKRGDIKLAQLCQLLAHLQKMAERRLNSGEVFYDPVLLCGDLNSTPTSPLCNFLTTGRLDYFNITRNSVSGLAPFGGPLLSYPIIPPVVGIAEHSCSFKVASTSIDSDTATCANFPIGTLAHTLSLSCAIDVSAPTGEKPISTMVNGRSELVDFIYYGSSHGSMTVQSKRNILDCIAHSSLLTDIQMVNRIGPLPNEYCGSDHLPLLAKFNYVQVDDKVPSKAVF